jgi:hypothetical protein
MVTCYFQGGPEGGSMRTLEPPPLSYTVVDHTALLRGDLRLSLYTMAGRSEDGRTVTYRYIPTWGDAQHGNRWTGDPPRPPA